MNFVSSTPRVAGHLVLASTIAGLPSCFGLDYNADSAGMTGNGPTDAIATAGLCLQMVQQIEIPPSFVSTMMATVRGVAAEISSIVPVTTEGSQTLHRLGEIHNALVELKSQGGASAGPVVDQGETGRATDEQVIAAEHAGNGSGARRQGGDPSRGLDPGHG